MSGISGRMGVHEVLVINGELDILFQESSRA
jgi:hypothetical protein